MKWLVFLLSICVNLSALAFPLDEQVISTSDNQCKIKYLSTKTKKMWSIELVNGKCKDGWLQGFAKINIKDPLNRTTETIDGFFHQGYWLTDFTQDISEFKRLSPIENNQAFIFPVANDPDFDVTYLAIAQSIRQENQSYPGFTICTNEPHFLIHHNPPEDFQQSLFQSGFLKNAKEKIKLLCPKSEKVKLFGTEPGIYDTTKFVFQADIDFKNDAVTIRTQDKKKISNAPPKPTEIRTESAENLLTVTPRKNQTLHTSYSSELPSPPPPPKQQENTMIIPWDDTNKMQSAIDLALMAKVFSYGVRGRTAVLVDKVLIDDSAIVTHPVSLILKNAVNVKPGWYTITAYFYQEKGTIYAQLLSAHSCQKEGCHEVR